MNSTGWCLNSRSAVDGIYETFPAVGPSIKMGLSTMPENK